MQQDEGTAPVAALQCVRDQPQLDLEPDGGGDLRALFTEESQVLLPTDGVVVEAIDEDCCRDHAGAGNVEVAGLHHPRDGGLQCRQVAIAAGTGPRCEQLCELRLGQALCHLCGLRRVPQQQHGATDLGPDPVPAPLLS